MSPSMADNLWVYERGPYGRLWTVEHNTFVGGGVKLGYSDENANDLALDVTNNVFIAVDPDGRACPIDGDLDGVALPDAGAYELDPDSDGDGHITLALSGDDCDAAAAYPGAADTCGDAIDQDCDGSDLVCPEDTGTEASPKRHGCATAGARPLASFAALAFLLTRVRRRPIRLPRVCG
ncbi:MAG: hypothetical protein EXR69_00305 [Myxococcales bacterium]|nr:hypothetical protein [Myxococcales bacterium]